jgi:hypothetical protein
MHNTPGGRGWLEYPQLGGDHEGFEWMEEGCRGMGGAVY